MAHQFEAFDGSSGMVCTAMVLRDDAGDQCGLTAAEHLDSNALEPIGYDSLGAPLYAHQVGPLGDE